MLADKLAKVDIQRTIVRKGPTGACEIYGAGDRADFEAVHNLRAQGYTWAEVHAVVDQALKLRPDQKIHADQFRYHWSGKCFHWRGVDL